MIRMIAVGWIFGLLTFASAASAQLTHLHVVEVGSGSPSFVVLHGGPGLTHDYLRPEWDALARYGPVLYYDQRGCGQSDWSGPLTWRQHVEDLEALLEERAPDEQVVLAGSSWGAVLALLYAHTYRGRISALVLSGLPPWRELVDARAARYEELSPAAKDSFRRSVERVSFDSYPVRDSLWIANRPGVLGDVISKRLRMGCPLAADIIFQSLYDAPRLADLRSISVRTLIIDGDIPDPRGSGAANVADVLPNATLRILPGTGHDPWLDRPDAFFDTVGEFLTRSQ
ncbi:MAG: alpha/beta fold hydrolase [Gemmatimonas sp.]|nr:alpha/beta fold hydrolase [Gemmatimonas sp.]